MKKITIILLSIMAISCNSNREKGKLVSTEEYKNLNNLAENNGKRFSIIGYAFIDRNLEVSQLGGVGERINFFEQPEGKGGFIGAFPIAHGQDKNEFNTPKEFTMKDVVFYDNDGKEIKSDQKIQVSFTMQLEVDREKIPENDIAGIKTGGGYYGGAEKVRLDKVE